MSSTIVTLCSAKVSVSLYFFWISKLSYLSLQWNRLTGTIPDEYYRNLSHLRGLQLEGNEGIHGTIERHGYLCRMRNNYRGPSPQLLRPEMKREQKQQERESQESERKLDQGGNGNAAQQLQRGVNKVFDNGQDKNERNSNDRNPQSPQKQKRGILRQLTATCSPTPVVGISDRLVCECCTECFGK